MLISQNSTRLPMTGRFTSWSNCALLAVLSFGFLLTSGTSAQAQRPIPTASMFPPRHDTNAWFISRQTGQPKYMVAALYSLPTAPLARPQVSPTLQRR